MTCENEFLTTYLKVKAEHDAGRDDALKIGLTAPTLYTSTAPGIFGDDVRRGLPIWLQVIQIAVRAVHWLSCGHLLYETCFAQPP